jgi:hypothetical protein
VFQYVLETWVGRPVDEVLVSGGAVVRDEEVELCAAVVVAVSVRVTRVVVLFPDGSGLEVCDEPGTVPEEEG